MRADNRHRVHPGPKHQHPAPNHRHATPEHPAADHPDPRAHTPTTAELVDRCVEIASGTGNAIREQLVDDFEQWADRTLPETAP
ncbi:hypothetical protein BKA24_000858 [Microbacterium marinum]|uniref:Uncharacterized protein n=1 Tax=Microbacterium marinum TaxID=421115 RepID=A0A7W7BNW9_9MICO|nr:hypothetical protein [Microbacterium marinum]MBB4666149.1 hypothetical protein [Microbacterium marinum]